MSSEINEIQRLRTVGHLAAIVLEYLEERQEPVVAHISLRSLHDVIVRWEREVERISIIQKAGVHPTKLISYQAFWIRKLKPISQAFRKSDVDKAITNGKKVGNHLEIVDINERVAFAVAVKYLIRYCEDGRVPMPLMTNAIGKPAPVGGEPIKEYFREYFKGSKRVHEDIIYNQRYRTFGPHHLTQFLEQVIFGAVLIQNRPTKK